MCGGAGTAFLEAPRAGITHATAARLAAGRRNGQLPGDRQPDEEPAGLLQPRGQIGIIARDKNFYLKEMPSRFGTDEPVPTTPGQNNGRKPLEITGGGPSLTQTVTELSR